jgi:hypothetical protein
MKVRPNGMEGQEMKVIALVCGLLSGLLGVLAALAFLKGGKPMPWNMQSYKGQTEAEKQFQSIALWWNKLGVMLLWSPLFYRRRLRLQAILNSRPAEAGTTIRLAAVNRQALLSSR